MGNGWGYKRAAVLSTFAMAIVTGLLVLVGCGGDDERSATGADAAATVEAKTAGANPVDTSSCKEVKPSQAKPASYEAPPQTLGKGEKLTVVVATSCGTFEIALDPKRAPTTVNSFVFLAEKGFYDGLEFDRAAPDAYVHGGDPPGDAGGAGYHVQGEIPRGLIYRYGTVAMGQSYEAAPGTVGSQFFVVLAKPWLDFSSLYSPLGKVEKGFDTLRRISAFGPVDKGEGVRALGVPPRIGKMREPVLIEEISIEKR